MISVLSAGETHDIVIEDVVSLFQSGEEIKILSYDKKIMESIVANTRTSSSKHFVYIQTDTETPLVVTPDSKIYDPETKEWIRAEHVNKNNHVLHADRSRQRVVDVHLIRDKNISKTYTLTVNPTQCYFANNILIHNER